MVGFLIVYFLYSSFTVRNHSCSAFLICAVNDGFVVYDAANSNKDNQVAFNQITDQIPARL